MSPLRFRANSDGSVTVANPTGRRLEGFMVESDVPVAGVSADGVNYIHILEGRYFTAPPLDPGEQVTLRPGPPPPGCPLLLNANSKGLQILNAIYDSGGSTVTLDLKLIRRHGLCLYNVSAGTGLSSDRPGPGLDPGPSLQVPSREHPGVRIRGRSESILPVRGRSDSGAGDGMSIEIRPLTDDDYPAWIRAKFSGFGYGIPESQLLRTPVEIDRSLAAYDSGRIVGTINSHTFRLRIPGGWIPMAGVAGVTVQPTHRRRGLMTRMMNRQLRDMHDRGEPATGLYASESIIYGRFGYGIATFHESWSIERLRTQMIPGDSGSGRVETISRSEALDLLPEVREKACYGRAGAIHRPNRALGAGAGRPRGPGSPRTGPG